MPTLNARNYSGVPGLNVREANGCIRFETPLITPTTTSGERLIYVNSSNNLIFDSGAATYILNGGGSGVSTWDGLYLLDKTLTINSTTLTFAGTHATNDVFTVTNASGSGDCIQITNSGTGYDIEGTSGLWYVAKTGDADFLSCTVGLGTADGVITSLGAYDLVLETNDGTNSSKMTITDAANGAITFAMNGTGKVVISGTTETNTSFQVTNGDAVISDGSLTITDDDNAAAVSVTTTGTSNAITVVADSVATGNVVDINADGLTSGYALHIDSSNGASFSTGGYLEIYDGSASCFTIARYGATVIAGTAVGTASLTLTTGDLSIADGNVAVTSTSTSDVFSITDDSLLANNALIVKGSGAFTGSTTSSFVAITPTGLLTGTALYIATAAATTTSICVDITTSTTTGTVMRLVDTGVQTDAATTGVLTMVSDSATTAGATAGRGLVSLSADALTTGTGVDITSTSITFTTGQLLNVSHISGSITGTLNCTTTGIVAVDASRTVTTGTVADDYDLGSFIRTQIINGAGSFSAAGAVVYVQNVTTNTSGTITDTVKGIEVAMDADGTGTGVQITHANAGNALAFDIVASQVTATSGVMRLTANSLTTGIGASFVLNGLTEGQGVKIASTSTGVTTGSLLLVSTGTTGAVATNGVVKFVATGAHTSTSNCGFVHVADATVTGTVMDIAFSGNVTTGVGLYISDGSAVSMTSGSLLRATTATTGAVATNGVISIRASGAYTSTSNAGLLDVAAAATTAGTVFNLAGNALTTGYLMNLSGTGVYTGTGLITLTATGATTGTIVNVLALGLTTGTAIKCSDNTGLTSGALLDLRANSSNTDASSIAYIEQTHASALNRVPLKTKQVAPTSTNYYKAQQIVTAVGTWTLWVGNGTNSPNGSLSGTAGDTCVNCDSGKSYYCTGTTNWTAY